MRRPPKLDHWTHYMSDADLLALIQFFARR
jgi:hypothetical protein